VINFDTNNSKSINETDSGCKVVRHQKTCKMEKKIFIICRQQTRLYNY